MTTLNPYLRDAVPTLPLDDLAVRASNITVAQEYRRHGDVSSALVEAVAESLAAAMLADDRLEDRSSLARASVEEIERRALHDMLTGVAPWSDTV